MGTNRQHFCPPDGFSPHDDRVRSLLFVPGDLPERFVRAEQIGADAVVIELAHAGPAAGKDEARAAVRDWLAEAPRGPVWIGINPGELGYRDVHTIVGPAVTGVCVAGTASASQLATL